MAKKWQNENTQMVPIATVPMLARQVTLVSSGQSIRSNREAPNVSWQIPRRSNHVSVSRSCCHPSQADERVH